MIFGRDMDFTTLGDDTDVKDRSCVSGLGLVFQGSISFYKLDLGQESVCYAMMYINGTVYIYIYYAHTYKCIDIYIYMRIIQLLCAMAFKFLVNMPHKSACFFPWFN